MQFSSSTILVWLSTDSIFIPLRGFRDQNSQPLPDTTKLTSMSGRVVSTRLRSANYTRNMVCPHYIEPSLRSAKIIMSNMNLLPGPIIRISPYEVHVNDPRFQDTLYRQDGRWEKYQWTYEPLGNSASMHGTMDHDIHRMRRAALNPFFSKQRILTATSSIQTQIEKLSSRLDRFVDSGKVVHIGAAYSALTMDVVTDYVLEKSYGNLDHEDFNSDFVTTINNQGTIWRVGKHVRLLSKLFFKAPLWAIRIISPSNVTYKVFLKVCLLVSIISRTSWTENSMQERGSAGPKPCLGRPREGLGRKAAQDRLP